MDYTNRIGCGVSEVKARILIIVYKIGFLIGLVLILVKLFLKK